MRLILSFRSSSAGLLLRDGPAFVLRTGRCATFAGVFFNAPVSRKSWPASTLPLHRHVFVAGESESVFHFSGGLVRKRERGLAELFLLTHHERTCDGQPLRVTLIS